MFKWSKPRYRVHPYNYDIYEWTPEIEDYTLVYTECKTRTEAESMIKKWGDA
jgi:hypothetical protein